MKGRRWPIITFILIGLNILCFLLTHNSIDEEQPHRSEVRLHLILLVADHPELQTSPEAAYETANFLHGGWIHLIGNMWFLWLAGFILEDTWGRVIYSIFYLVAGAAALRFYAWCSQGSFIPLVGASGAVAALMGAFLIRFPKLKIENDDFPFLLPRSL